MREQSQPQCPWAWDAAGLCPEPTSEPITPPGSNRAPHLRMVTTAWVSPGPSLANPVGFTPGSKATAALKTQLGGGEALKPAWGKAAYGQALFVGAAPAAASCLVPSWSSGP